MGWDANDKLRLMISVIIPLIVFCAVLSIQIINGFQNILFILILIFLILGSVVLFCLAIKYYKEVNDDFKWSGRVIFITLLMGFVWLLLCGVVGSVFLIEEVTFNYPQNGDPVPQNLSMSGTYRNIDNNTNLWLYTHIADGRWFLVYANKVPYSPGCHNGYWFTNNSKIGSDENDQRGYFFTLGFFLVPNQYNESFKNFSIKFREHGNTTLPPGKDEPLKNNITVFRMYPQI